RRLEDGADMTDRIGEIPVGGTVDRRAARRRPNEAEEDPERGRLARAVRAEERRNRPLPDAEAEPVDRRRLPVALPQLDDLDHTGIEVESCGSATGRQIGRAHV